MTDLDPREDPDGQLVTVLYNGGKIAALVACDVAEAMETQRIDGEALFSLFVLCGCRNFRNWDMSYITTFDPRAE